MARKRRNQKPSFVADTLDTFAPTGFMERTARGITGDFRTLKDKIMGRRNPNELSTEALGARLGLAAVVPGGVVALTALEVAEALDKGMIDGATGVLVKPMEEIAEVVQNPKPYVHKDKHGQWKAVDRHGYHAGTFHHSKKKEAVRASRRNPEDSSALAYEIFHGEPPKGTTEILEEIHEHENLWALGILISLEIEPLSMPGKVAKYEWDSENPWLCGDEPSETSGGLFEPSQMVCRQLFVRGGDQKIDLNRLKMGKGSPWYREQMVIGYLIEATYHTQKGFDNFKPVDYYHALGEESGVVPMVCYDTRNQMISIVGGQYEIRAEGICN